MTPARSHRAAAKKTTKPPPWSMLHCDVVIVLNALRDIFERHSGINARTEIVTAGIKPIAKAAV